DHAPVAVAQQLEFDVARILDVFLHVDVGNAESLFRLVAGGAKRGHDFGRRAHDAHAAPAASGRGFDHQRIADVLAAAEGGVLVFHHAGGTGNDGQAGGG